MNTADVLREAAAVIEERGWTQGTFEEEDGSVCVLGALRRCASSHDAQVALGAFVADHVAVWNDDPLRTEEQVTKTLRACADSLESDER